MKLSEIRDITSYRKGDENNPRSPDYEERTVEFDDVIDINGFDIYNADSDLVGKADMKVKVVAEFDLRRPKNGWDIQSVKIQSADLNGKSYTGDELKKEFGEDTFEYLKDEAKADLDKHNDPTDNSY